MKKILLSAFALTLLAPSMRAQLQVDTTASVTQLQTFLAGAGITISNLSVNCPPVARGIFSNGTTTNLGMGAGFVMSTGEIATLPGPNNSSSTSGQTNGVMNDPDMDSVCGYSTFDGCILEFDVTPTHSNILFNYIFASEEYNEWVGSGFNDAFAIFFSGPGFPVQNVALLPGGTTPVTVNNVNMGSNPTYFVNNDSSMVYPTDSARIQPDGFTTNLTALISGLVANNTYHFKIGVADALDAVWDASVFLQAASFRSQELTGVDAAALGVKAHLAPNPSGGLLQLWLSGIRPGSEISIDLHDLTGRLIYNGNPVPDSMSGYFSADLSAMNPGPYVLTVHTEKGDLSLRWIKY